MLHPKYNWEVGSIDEQQAFFLANQLNVPHVVGTLLYQRGFTDFDQAKSFLYGGLTELHDPFLMSGVREAVDRIKQALLEKEKILIYGDYDADGVSSTSLMIHLMRKLGADFDYYIPHRSKEGYGLHIHAIQKFHEQGYTLIVTVDTGISAVEQIEYANSLGIDVIVTDHHEPPAVLPNAYTLINPKLEYCNYPFKGLAGVGVAYKLAQALLGEHTPQAWIELVTIGTIADLMPLKDENRILVTYGLKLMNASSFPGIRALLMISGNQQNIVNAVQVGFGLAPRINASGRMSHASRAVELLTATDMEQAETIAEELDVLNKQRQLLVEEILIEAIAQVEQKVAQAGIPDVIVVAGENWNVGVVGIVASKLLDRYYRPVIVLGIDPETGLCKGSARSIADFDIYQALTACSELMDHYGGHPAAAGMSLAVAQLEQFEQQLNSYAQNILTPAHFTPAMQVDMACNVSDLTIETIEHMEELAPFGMNNPCPKLLIRGAKLLESRQLGKDNKHLKLLISQQGCTIEAIAFNKGNLTYLLSEDATLDLVVEVSINEWNGKRKPQLFIQDIAVPHVQVFDYRHTKSAHLKLEQLAEKLEASGVNASAKNAVFVQAGFQNLFRENQLHNYSLWIYDEKEGLLPSNDIAKGMSLAEVTTIFIMHLPTGAKTWHYIQGKLSSLERIYLLHDVHKPEEQVISPTREHFKELYAMIRSVSTTSENELLPYISKKTGLSRRMLSMALEVFKELEFITWEQGEIRLNPAPSKRALETSTHFIRLQQLAEVEQLMVNGEVARIRDWMLKQKYA